jgi:glutathione S-transferase
VRLFHRWKCPWCAAARQAIENVGAEVELVEVPYPREERDEVERVSGQRRVPVLVDGDVVVVESRRVVRHLYTRYGDDSFARSIAELDRDILADGDAPVAGEACEVHGGVARPADGVARRAVP